MRESTVPISEQEISNLLEIRLAKVQQRIDSLFGEGLIEQVPGPHWRRERGEVGCLSQSRPEKPREYWIKRGGGSEVGAPPFRVPVCGPSVRAIRTRELYDLYCGIGTIGQTLASKALTVWGVEVSEESVACALENADLNGISNAAFFAGEVGASLEELR